MKIGFLINALSSGGAERATVSLAEAFAKQGHDVKILTFRSTESFYPVSDNVKILSAEFNEIEHNASLKRFNASINRMFSLRRFIKNQQLDILIGMSFSMTYYAVFSTVFTNTKSIGTERNNPYKYKASKLNTVMRKLFSFFADGYVFQTKKSAEFFSRRSQKRGIIIPNAIFNQEIYKLTSPIIREKNICGIGRLTEQKRFDILINAFSDIADSIPEYKLTIFGNGELKESLQSIIDKRNMSDRITLAGAVNDAYKTVCNSSLFVLCSDYEGMPNALMESIAMGVPSISTRCDMGPEELIENGENGLLIDTGNTSQLSEAMLKIIQNPQLAERISLQGRKLLITHSIDEISKQWINYITNI